jgi:hypothetical protein
MGAVRVKDFLDNREAQAQTAALILRIRTRESLKEPGPESFGDPTSRIPDRYPDAAATGSADPDRDAPSRVGELDRIRKQIPEDSEDPVLVPSNPDRRAAKIHRQLEPFASDLRLKAADGQPYRFVQPETFRFGSNGLVDRRHAQQFLRQTRQPLNFVTQGGHTLPLPFVQGARAACQEGFALHAQGFERLSQVMSNIGGKVLSETFQMFQPEIALFEGSELFFNPQILSKLDGPHRSEHDREQQGMG